MLVIKVSDATLERELHTLLQFQFDGDVERMLQQLVEAYTAKKHRLQYSGVLKWPVDALAYQKDMRHDW